MRDSFQTFSTRKPFTFGTLGRGRPLIGILSAKDFIRCSPTCKRQFSFYEVVCYVIVTQKLTGYSRLYTLAVLGEVRERRIARFWAHLPLSPFAFRGH